MKAPEKKRLDLRLVELGLCETRSKAQALILSGSVLVNDTPETKAGALVSEEAEIRFKKGAEQDQKYVSRGAHKLVAALQSFSVSVVGKKALDVGASTGGFTQVLLEAGATEVIALDVGHSQLDWKIRSDARVRVLEKVNARNLSPEDLPFIPEVIVMDVSFISVTKILPALSRVGAEGHDLIILIKPQFEVEKGQIGKGGIVKDSSLFPVVIEKIKTAAMGSGYDFRGIIDSPILGTDGNREFLAYWNYRHGLKD
jgi:23S rRNA (cytidine1920-2'-O)/16S rRNA (cytidine1409-2'-O)-methyltransferase